MATRSTSTLDPRLTALEVTTLDDIPHLPCDHTERSVDDLLEAYDLALAEREVEDA